MYLKNNLLMLACCGLGFACSIGSAMATEKVTALPTVYSGVGHTGSQLAFDTFRAAIGGTNASRIAWDGVKLDGTDANPNTRIIDFGKTVEIPVDRFRAVGAIYAEPYAVSGDSFSTVNPGTAGQFPSFSFANTFAMFDPNNGQFKDRAIEQSFVIPGTHEKAATRGFGAIFVDVELQNSSHIEYFGKDKYGNKVSLGKFAVPPGKNGEPQFLGVMYDKPIITDVVVTPGVKALFSFDGVKVRAFGHENLQNGTDLAVTDDFLFARPEQAKPVE